MTDRDIQNAPIRWKVQGAGFVIGAGGFVALVDRNPDPYACTAYGGPPEDMETHLRTCRETWATVWALEGDTLGGGEAVAGGVAAFPAPPTT